MGDLTADQPSIGAQQHVTSALWCPFCQAPMPESMVDRIHCPACHREVDLPAARVASDCSVAEVQARADFEALRAHVADLEVKAAIAKAHVANLRDMWQAANLAAQQASQQVVPQAAGQGRRATTTDAAVPPAPSGHAPAAEPETMVQPSPHPKVRAPMALILQGTGAVLLLAALVTLSAVLWGVLPGWGQVSLLLAMVVLIGVLAVVTRKVVPTTSTVLAVLAAASLVVVLLAAPALLPQWQSMLYPGLAGTAFTASTMAVGHLTRTRLWWLTGVASIPVAAVLLVISAFGTIDLDVPPPWEVALAVALLAPVNAALFLWARSQRSTDRETFLTGWISAGVSAVLLGLLAASWLAILAIGQPAPWWSTEAPSVLAGAAAVAVFAVAGKASRDVWPAWSTPLHAVAGALAGGALAVVAIVPTRSPGTAVAMGLLVVFLAAALRLLRSRWAGFELPGDVASGVFSGAALLMAFASSESFRAFQDFQELAIPAGQARDLTWMWLAAVIAGIGLGAVAITEGFWRRVRAFVIIGYVVAALSWFYCWTWGEIGDVIEVWTVPVGVLALVLWNGLQRSGMIRRSYWQEVVLLTVLPSLLAAAIDPQLDRVSTWWRVLGVAVATAAVITIPARRDRVASFAAWAMWLVLPWWVYTVWVAPEADRLPELIAIPSAAAAASLVAWWVEPTSRGAWWAVVRWPLLAATAVSVVWALVFPFTTAGLVAPLRVTVLVVGLALVTVFWWPHRALAAAAGSVGIAVGWWSLAAWLPPISQEVEWQTLPAAAALAAVMALIVRARGGLSGTPLGSALAIGLPAGLALVPSAIVAVGQVADGAGLTVRFALVVAASAVAVLIGVVRRLSGLLFAGLAALLIAVTPVLFQVVESLPLWLPLSLVGALLLVIGARFEHVRRRGQEAAHWMVHLR